MPLNDKAQKMVDKLETEKEQIKHSTEEMSAELKRLLESEINAFQKREKHRSTEMIAIFARHNFYANGFTPQELRTTLEDLGPTYVKIGQIMSSRVDLLPVGYCRELAKLRDSVKPLDPAVAKAVIEQETGKKIDEIYSEFRDIRIDRTGPLWCPQGWYPSRYQDTAPFDRRHDAKRLRASQQAC